MTIRKQRYRKRLVLGTIATVAAILVELIPSNQMTALFGLGLDMVGLIFLMAAIALLWKPVREIENEDRDQAT